MSKRMSKKMFKKILIANRGEIAVRVIRTAKQMGIQTVAVFSEADRNAMHVKLADESVLIGEAPPSQSYLLADRIIQAALDTQSEAIHPGYGFLSENAPFCQACEDQGLVFIGPPVAAIEAMGSKSAAKNIMGKAGVPLVPGYHGEDQSPALLSSEADKIGYPVLLKAVAGGGGKGMRRVDRAEDLKPELASAQREAISSFGDDKMLVEKFVLEPRHVEVQVFCDQHGDGVYLFERDCSIQRRHQKIVEEAPAPGISEALRKQLGEAALNAARSIDYVGAGTVEFLLDVNHDFYFMEMNTRLQVEHPVTEMITGQDLVAWQFKIASGEPLPLEQEDLSIQGHALEARIYAEDPANDYLPAAGQVNYLSEPSLSETVRLDTGVSLGDDVGVFYDPMIAKLIVWGENRSAALAKMSQALQQYHIGGVTTNVPFLRRLLSSQPFQDAELQTGFLDSHRASLEISARDLQASHLFGFLFLVLQRSQKANKTSSTGDPWGQRDDWRLNSEHQYQFDLHVEGQSCVVSGRHLKKAGMFEVRMPDKTIVAMAELKSNTLLVEVEGERQTVFVYPHQNGFVLVTNENSVFVDLPAEVDYETEGENAGSFHAPMNGTVIDILKIAGEAVQADEPIVIMEAMKMEHVIRAPAAGLVKEIFCQKGDLVSGGDTLVDFEAEVS